MDGSKLPLASRMATSLPHFIMLEVKFSTTAGPVHSRKECPRDTRLKPTAGPGAAANRPSWRSSSPGRAHPCPSPGQGLQLNTDCCAKTPRRA